MQIIFDFYWKKNSKNMPGFHALTLGVFEAM